MAELAVPLNGSDHEIHQFLGNHMKALIPEIQTLCMLCSWDATDTLADGVLYACGNNGECLCVSREDDCILEPTVVNCEGRN